MKPHVDELAAIARAFDRMRPSRTAELAERIAAAADAVEAGRRLLELELGQALGLSTRAIRVAFAVDAIATAAAFRAVGLARFPADAQRVEAALERFACQARELAAGPFDQEGYPVDVGTFENPDAR